MPKGTFFRLEARRRDRLVEEAVIEFASRPYAEASLSEIARRSGVAKGSLYQYFENKLDLYRWLVTEEATRRKREFLDASMAEGAGFWTRLETLIERGMAFLVEQPLFARLAAVAADPSASNEVRGLHKAICEAGMAELRATIAEGVARGELSTQDIDVTTRLVFTVIGPGLTEVVLHELGAELHEVLATDRLRRRLGPTRRRRLASQTVLFLRSGLGANSIGQE